MSKTTVQKATSKDSKKESLTKETEQLKRNMPKKEVSAENSAQE